MQSHDALLQNFCSAAMRSREVRTVIGELGTGMPGGTTELRSVLEILKYTKRQVHVVGPDRLVAKQGSDGLPEIEIYSLSPSDAAIEQSIVAIASMALHPGDRRLAKPWPRSNLTSIVLWITSGDESVLLGADLEKNANGWATVHESPLKPEIRANLFKVPHHGSEDAYHKATWDELVSSPVAVVAPFLRGRVLLPTDAGLDRICRHVDVLWLTSPTRTPRRVVRDRTVDRTIAEVVREMRRVEHSAGQVRCRRKPGAS
jgi:hypothetical protein